MDIFEQLLSEMAQGGWMVPVLRISLIVLFTTLTIALSHWLIERFSKLVSSGIRSQEAQKRAKTLSRILKSVIYILILLVSLMLILSELKIDIKPIIAAAGVGGIAIGFGAQNLIKDLISGFFLLLEDQIRVGDVVKIGDTTGEVVDIRLRVLLLRDLSGNLHIIPHGNIAQVTNMTHSYSYWLFDFAIAYKEDVERVIKVIKEVAEEMKNDPGFKDDILEPAEVFGLDRFEESGVIIRGRVKTKPMTQWRVGRELNLRIKNRFDALGIEIPFPHRTIYFGNLSKNLVESNYQIKEESDENKEF
jgi:small conductance mechanosensitive channel